MRIIITDIDSGEEETISLPAPRENQYLADKTVRARREFAIDAVILEGLKFIANQDTAPRFIASPNSRQHIIDLRVVNSLNALFDPQNEINNPPSFEALYIPCLRAARVHQLYRDRIGNVAGNLAALFDDPFPSSIEDSDNPFPED